MEIKIYVANLGKYNEGILQGEWFTLPVEFEEIAEKIGLNEQYEEYAIHDYEAPDGLKINEYSSINELNEIAEEMENLSEYDEEILGYILATGEKEFNEALEMVQNGGDFYIFRDCNNMSDVAYQWLEETGGLSEIPDHLQSYFDFEAYGRDLEIEGSFYQVKYDVYVQLF